MLAKLSVNAGPVSTIVTSAVPTMVQRGGFKPIDTPLRVSISWPPSLVHKTNAERLIASLPLNYWRDILTLVSC